MSENHEPRRTPLYDLHLAAGAKMVEFGGWLMPVQYDSIVAEHRMVRRAVGLFDLSHMGRIYVEGRDAERFLQILTTNDVSRLAVGQAQYSLICNEKGGVRDDILVYRLEEREYLLVVNAANRAKILEWMDWLMAAHAPQMSVRDRTLETVMVGVQGPAAERFLQPFVDGGLGDLRYYRGSTMKVGGGDGFVSRTGYTGEDGFEVILDSELGTRLWGEMQAVLPSVGGALCGLGARDTLRLEAGMPLYGHELGEDINPLEAGLDRHVRLEKPDFVGREALVRVAAMGPVRRLVGLLVKDRAIARQGTPVLRDSTEVGAVTSGSFSPTLEQSIAMALVATKVATERPEVEVSVRGVAHPAAVVDLPFYRRPRG